MNGNDLADAIIDACKDCDPKADNPLTTQLKIQDTVASYIEDNMEIKLKFTGINASGATKIIDCSAKIQFPVFTFLPAVDSNTFAVLLATALKGGLIQAEKSSLVVLAPPGLLNPAGFFAGFVPTDMTTKDNKDFDSVQFARKYWSNIVKQIKSNFINPIPYPATSDAGVFVGTASTISIS